MKAITLYQPYATLIAIGAKHYETRSWGTSYRGPIAIHAAKTMPQWAREICFEEPYLSTLFVDGDGINYRITPRFGCVVAVADLTGIWTADVVKPGATPKELAFGDFGPGRFAWRLENVRPVDPPYPVRGRQGLWDLPGFLDGSRWVGLEELAAEATP